MININFPDNRLDKTIFIFSITRNIVANVVIKISQVVGQSKGYPCSSPIITVITVGRDSSVVPVIGLLKVC